MAPMTYADFDAARIKSNVGAHREIILKGLSKQGLSAEEIIGLILNDGRFSVEIAPIVSAVSAYVSGMPEVEGKVIVDGVAYFGLKRDSRDANIPDGTLRYTHFAEEYSIFERHGALETLLRDVPNFDIRPRNQLLRDRYNTIDEVMGATEGDILRVRGFGPMMFELTTKAFHDYSLELSESA